MLCGQRFKSLGVSSRVLNTRAATLSKSRFSAESTPSPTAKTYHRDALRPRDDGNPDDPNDLDDPNDPDDKTLVTLTYPSIP
jgi:hypothetical protein